MSSADPFLPNNTPIHPPITSDLDLHGGQIDGPDVLDEVPVDEPDLAAVIRQRDLPIRKPAIGEQLTESQLAEEIGAD